jgi:hypothetical protein
MRSKVQKDSGFFGAMRRIFMLDVLPAEERRWFA